MEVVGSWRGVRSCVAKVGKSRDEVTNWEEVFKCQNATLPISYLGLPLGGRPSSKSFLSKLIQRVEIRLASWKKKFLHKGGRLILIKTVMSSIPIYYMSVFKMPVWVSQKLERLQRNFFWGDGLEKNKIHAVDWDIMCKKDKSLWKRVVCDKYGIPMKTLRWDWNGGTKGSAFVKAINSLLDQSTSHGKLLEDGIAVKVDRGDIANFWTELLLILSGMVCAAYLKNARRILRSPVGRLAEFQKFLAELIQRVEIRLASWKKKFLHKGEDKSLWKRVVCDKYGIPMKTLRWDWSGGTKGSAFVKAINSLLDQSTSHGKLLEDGIAVKVDRGDIANFWTDLKVEGHSLKIAFPRIFALDCVKTGSLIHGRILVRYVLYRFGMSECPLCLLDVETIDHLFLRCSVLKWLRGWRGLCPKKNSQKELGALCSSRQFGRYGNLGTTRFSITEVLASVNQWTWENLEWLCGSKTLEEALQTPSLLLC
ncbi:hypothetical protein Dsin_013332 [Dipteronia sinensis]|uniref:Reverse transcriptase zinc-binding domain-containing protein n=1 Tax=Dipteronia sinensis TaxID=43782 RepID=A0AAE0AJV3_9ROSI|nr:hypothetical protein Dsin_013332 [Dipteronia sinensis]